MINKLKKGFVIAAMAGMVFTANEQAVTVSAATKNCAATVTSKNCGVGTTFNCGNLKYKVTGKNTVTCTGLKNKKSTQSKCTIPSTVTCDGKKYKVTSVSSNAFRNCKNLKSVCVPNTVNSIGSTAFANCSGLNKIYCSKTIAQSGSNFCGNAVCVVK